MKYSILKKIGYDFELEVYDELKKYFKKVIWFSKKHPTAPYDFVCYDNQGKKYLFDAKSCLWGVISIPESKYCEFMKNKYKNFYFILKTPERFFEVYSYNQLLNSKRFKFKHRKARGTVYLIRKNKKLMDLSKLKLKVWVNKSNGQKLITIPSFSTIEKGDQVWIDKAEV